MFNNIHQILTARRYR